MGKRNKIEQKFSIDRRIFKKESLVKTNALSEV